MHVQALTKCCPSVPDVGKLCLDAPIPGLVYMSVRPSLVDLTRLFAATPCVRPSSPPPPPHNHHTTRTPSNISNNTSTRTLTHAGVLCSSDSQTNFVNVHQHDGTILPWIEINEEQTAAAQVTEPPKPKTKNRMSSTTWTNVWKAAAMGKVGRNDPCPCKSGKKFKKCCGGGSGAAAAGPDDGD
eukprot:334443-Rhodomonas_salina.2